LSNFWRAETDLLDQSGRPVFRRMTVKRESPRMGVVDWIADEEDGADVPLFVCPAVDLREHGLASPSM
jgi:hypothetical protein